MTCSDEYSMCATKQVGRRPVDLPSYHDAIVGAELGRGKVGGEAIDRCQRGQLVTEKVIASHTP